MPHDNFLKKLERHLQYLYDDPYATETEIEKQENVIRAYKKLQ